MADRSSSASHYKKSRKKALLNVLLNIHRLSRLFCSFKIWSHLQAQEDGGCFQVILQRRIRMPRSLTVRATSVLGQFLNKVRHECQGVSQTRTTGKIYALLKKRLVIQFLCLYALSLFYTRSRYLFQVCS